MAGEGDAERLVVLLEARTNDALKAMDRAEKKFDRAYGQMRRGSRTATQQMEADMTRTTSRIDRAIAATSTKIGSFGKAMVAGFAGGLVAGGIAGLVSQIGQIASAVASVGDEAKRAGVDVEAFQELRYVAEQNRIGVDSLTDGLKELNLRADEFITTGAGPAAEAFQRIGLDAETLKAKLEDPSALFTEIIGKLGQLDKAAQIRIADEIFGGTGGEKFVQLIGQGEAGIKATIQQARNLGMVMDSELIDKAAELDREFNTVATTVGTALKTAIVEAASALSGFIQQFMAFEHRNSAALEERLEFLKKGGLGNGPGNRSEGADNAAAAAEIAEIEAELRRRAIEQLRMGLAALPGQATGETLPPSGLPVPPSSGGSRGSATSDIERQEEAVRNLIAGLEFEKSLIGLSQVEQEKLTLLRQAGAAATDKQREKIAELVEQTYAEQMRVEQLGATFDMLGQAGMSAVQGIISALDDGKISAEEFGDILSNVLGMASQLFLNQAFGGFGSFFGIPGRANGGRVEKGQPYIVGERRPELFVPDQAGTIVPSVPSVMGSQSTVDQRVFAPVININGSGLNQQQMTDAIADALDRFKRKVLPGEVNRLKGQTMVVNG